MRMHRAAVVGAMVIVAGLGLGACGGSEGGSGDGAGDDAATTTEQAAGAAGASSGGKGGDFCAAARALRDGAADLSKVFEPTAEKERVARADAVRAAMRSFADAAPSEVAADAGVLAKEIGVMLDAYARYGYDMDRAGKAAATDDALIAVMSDEAAAKRMSDANTRIDAHLSTACGFTLS